MNCTHCQTSICYSDVPYKVTLKTKVSCKPNTQPNLSYILYYLDKGEGAPVPFISTAHAHKKSCEKMDILAGVCKVFAIMW